MTRPIRPLSALLALLVFALVGIAAAAPVSARTADAYSPTKRYFSQTNASRHGGVVYVGTARGATHTIGRVQAKGLDLAMSAGMLPCGPANVRATFDVSYYSHGMRRVDHRIYKTGCLGSAVYSTDRRIGYKDVVRWKVTWTRSLIGGAYWDGARTWHASGVVRLRP